MSDRIQQLEREISRYKDESSKAQTEVDRLLEILKEVENEKNDKDKKIAELERQVKDQNKKVANLKHKEQVEKKKSAQMLEEARRREDSLSDSSQQLQVEELLMAMEKVKQELESMKAKLSSTQQSLAEKETHLTNLRAERRKHLEEVLEMKQEALLAAISEKDANIALLELSSSKKKTQEEVAALKREKDRLVQQLKQQTQNRMKLMADNYEDDHFRSSRSNQTNHKPSPDQDEEEDGEQAAWENELQKMTQEQLQNELEKVEGDNAELQEFANTILQQIADHCPDILEQVVNALEESS